MKKILSFFVAGALALGLIGCSGDLHDYEANEECIGLYLAGDIQADGDNRAKLKFVDETTQTYAFTYDSSKMTYWGGSKGTINFKLVTDATTWTQDFGWKKDTPVVIDMNGDFLTLQARDAANSNPGNIKVENLIDGKEYVITVNYDAPNKVAKVKIAGPAIDFPTLKVVTDKTEGGNPVEYPLTREGTTYKYIWTPTEAGSFKFYVTNGYMYYGKDGKIDIEKPDTDDYVEVTYEAGEEYAITIETAYDKGTDVKIKAGILDTSILAKADIIGAFDGWTGSPLVRVDDVTYTYDFKNAATTVEFAIREEAGSWSVGRWFGGIEKGVDTDRPDGATIAEPIIAAKKGETATKQTPTYYKGDAGDKGNNLKITGLPYVGHNFRVTATIVDADKKEISLTVQALEDIPAADYEPPKYAKVYLAGDAPLSWDIGKETAIAVNIVAEKEECKKYYYTFTAAGTSLNFKVALNNSWSDAYSNCKDADGETKTILNAAPVDFIYANAKNAVIEGLSEGEKYTMVIDTSSEHPKVSVVSGSDVLFAIGNDDFGNWSWDTPVMMNPAGTGEWKYEFTATKAEAEFKFQTTCGGWHDADTWNAKKAITVGGEYVEMENSAGGNNTSAALTVGTKYVLSVKNIDGKYNVKIATAE